MWTIFRPLEALSCIIFSQVPAAHLTGFDFEVDRGIRRQEATHPTQLGILDSAQSPTVDRTRIFFPAAQGGAAVYLHQQTRP